MSGRRRPVAALLALGLLFAAAGAAQGAINIGWAKDDFYHDFFNTTVPALGNFTSAGDNSSVNGAGSGPINASVYWLNFSFEETAATNNDLSQVYIDFPDNWTVPRNGSCPADGCIAHNMTVLVSPNFFFFQHNKTAGLEGGVLDQDPTPFNRVNVSGIGISNPTNPGDTYVAEITIKTNATPAGATVHLLVIPGPQMKLVATRPGNQWYNNTTGNDPSDANHISLNVTVRDRNPISTVAFEVENATGFGKDNAGTLQFRGNNSTSEFNGDDYSVTFPIANWGGNNWSDLTTPANQSMIQMWDGNWTVEFNATDTEGRFTEINTSGHLIAIDRTRPRIVSHNATGCVVSANREITFTVADDTGQNYSDNSSGSQWIRFVVDNNPSSETCYPHLSSFASLGGSDTGTAPYTAVCRNTAALTAGNHAISIEVFDKTGNNSTNTTSNFRIETVQTGLAVTNIDGTATTGTSYSTSGSTVSDVKGTVATPGAVQSTITFNGAAVTDKDAAAGGWATGSLNLECGTNTVKVDHDAGAGACPASQLTVTIERSCGGGGTTTTTSSGTTSAPAPTPVVETESVLSISPFTPVTTTFTQTEAVKQVTIETQALAAAVSVTVTEHLSKPASVAAPPASVAAAVNRYISIDAKNIFESDYSRVTLRFDVERTWLDANNVSDDRVALARHDDAKAEWNSYPATKVREEGGKVTYDATVPKLSVFAIIAAPAPEAAPTPAATEAPSPSPTTVTATPPPGVETPAPTAAPTATPPPAATPAPSPPGFEALAAIAALGVALALVERRKR